MLWTTLNAELSAVDEHVQVASEFVWTSQQLDDQAETRLQAGLVAYLNVMAKEDLEQYQSGVFKQGNTTPFPSNQALTDLRKEVESTENYTSGDESIQAILTQQVTELVGSRESIRSIAGRVLPDPAIYILLAATIVV